MQKSMKYENYRKFAVVLAKKAGDFIYKNFGKINKIEKKGFRDYVTNIDKESEEIIISAIRKKFPTHSILSEEKGSMGEKSDYLWIIDPLDGTHNYMAKIPFYGVCLALCFKEKPIAGVIYLPHLKEIYEAELGKGSCLNGKKIKVSLVKLLEESFVFHEGGFQRKTEEKIKNIKILIKEAEKTRIIGCSSLQLAYVACGRATGYIGETGTPWDLTASYLIVKEAGGKVTNFEGKEFTIKDEYIIATNGKIHNQLLKILKS